MQKISSQATAVINLAALRHNFQTLRESREIFPVLKSDAYGCGLLRCALTLDAMSCAGYCVGFAAEGALLRRNGITAPIVPLMGCVSLCDYELCARHDLTPLVHNFHDIEILGQLLDANGNVALKINSGMNRLGFAEEELPAAIEALKENALYPQYVISHLARADDREAEKYNEERIALIKKMFALIKNEFNEARLSYGNSASLLKNEKDRIYRPGITLYGVEVENGIKAEKLRQVMSFYAPVIETRAIKKGEPVSYGGIWQAPEDTNIAVIAMGYANGLDRNLSGKIRLRVGTKIRPQIGRICMNMIMIDAGACQTRIGEKAWLLDEEISINNYPANAYETLCALGSLNNREYINPAN